MKKLLLLLVLFALPAHAACTGSGTKWACSAGSTSFQIQTALDRAADGAIITFEPGSYTVTGFSKFSNSKGATLICATAPPSVGAAEVNPCIINAGAQAAFGSDSFSGVNTHFYRISGFVFDLGGTHSSFGTLYWDSYNGGTHAATLKRIRVDHNTFQNGSTGAQTTLIGSGGEILEVYGVYDHNLYRNVTQFAVVIWVGGVNPSPPQSQLGTANNLFIEDNVLTFLSVGNASAEGCTDGWGGSAYVVRHNISTNCLWAAHGVTHAGGPANYEFYNNFITMGAGAVIANTADCYRCFHHQGSGEFIAFNNVFKAFIGKSDEAMSMLHYRDYPNSIDGGAPQCDGTVTATPWLDGNRSPKDINHGYPCWRQPGRDFATGNLMPMYVWNNYWSDTQGQIRLNTGGGSGYRTQHMQADREWYDAVSASAQNDPATPFNGTTGMGFGTLANRPTTCTTNPNETGGGVGYFATDVGTQGTLYQCSTTNNWTVWYTPYTYPHPLAGGGSSNSVAPPTNLSIIVN
jgi:hypothetical protein